MKIVHSYIPTAFGDKPAPDLIWKELMYGQMLSVLLAQREFGNISLYTNEHIARQIKDVGLPYTDINTSVLEGVSSKSYTYPKMRVFREIGEPYLHIDTDTYIFKKLDFSKATSPVVYAHSDQAVEFKERVDSDVLSQYINNISKCYTSLFFLHDEEFQSFNPPNVNLMKIPNGNLTYVRDPKIFIEATNKALTYYYKHKDIIDRNTYGGVYVEQMIIHLYLMELSPEYKEAVDENRHLVCDNIFMHIDYGSKDKTVDYLNYTYPFKFKLHTLKDGYISELEQAKNIATNLGYKLDKDAYKEYVIEKKEDLVKYFNHDFLGVLHPSFNKWAPLFECLTIGIIAEQFGLEYVNLVHNYYKKTYPSYYLPLKSRGEKLYEELTGFEFGVKNVI